jgi:ATP-dependent phosphofructokinase / diphosphate-dependent phosphofructokinase
MTVCGPRLSADESEEKNRAEDGGVLDTFHFGIYVIAMNRKLRVGLLTGGGDAPGLNGILEATSLVLLNSGAEVFGIQDGFEGIFNENVLPITWQTVDGIHSKAGTLLGTTNKTATAGREVEFIAKYKKLNLDILIAAGGDGTFAGLSPFKDDIPLIGVPKTIDNDLAGTDITFGFDTACSVVAESVDALRATANAHRRVILVETMGRTAGWIALGGGLASYADVILIPERPFNEMELMSFLKSRREMGKRGLVLSVAEGAFATGSKASVALVVPDSPQPERYGGIAERLARIIEKNLAWESRHVVLGHLQRSRPPTTTDRFLTLSMGVLAAQLALQRRAGAAVVFRNGQVQESLISEFMKAPRLVDHDHRWVKMAQSVGIFV